MTAETLLDPAPVVRIGRKPTLHHHRVLIENAANGHAHVVVTTRCGIRSTTEGWTETYGLATCEDCVEAWEGLC